MLNQVSEPVQPIRSAITVAGISGCSDKIERTLALNGANAVATALRSAWPADPTPPHPDGICWRIFGFLRICEVVWLIRVNRADCGSHSFVYDLLF